MPGPGPRPHYPPNNSTPNDELEDDL
jgi:hypothetical protein